MITIVSVMMFVMLLYMTRGKVILLKLEGEREKWFNETISGYDKDMTIFLIQALFQLSFQEIKWTY